MLIDLATGRKRRELLFITAETLSVLADIKHGLDDCYALLAPVDPGSTLAVSTPRNEAVKGFVTRVGTRIVKGTLHLQLKTAPPTTLSINPAVPIHIASLAAVHVNLTRCIDLATFVLHSAPEAVVPARLSPQLRVLSLTLADSLALLAGRAPPPDHPSPSSLPAPETAADWTRASCAAASFSPPLPPTLSVHLVVQDSCLVLHLRALESADAPVNLGTKLGLAIGTVRRLEHDEMDRVFRLCPDGVDSSSQRPASAPVPETAAAAAMAAASVVPSGRRDRGRDTTPEVYVREKVRVESADPCLMSLATKLRSLSYTLTQARQNLAAVLGEELED